MDKGRKERVKIRTNCTLYTGNLNNPERRKQFSDVINDQGVVFINLRTVGIDQGMKFQ
jgi:hypothetical protein